MFVPSYQMHNVLNVYSNKLKRNIRSEENKNTLDKTPFDRITLTSEGKRRTTIEKVSKEIFDKIIRLGSQAESPQGISGTVNEKSENGSKSAEMDKSGFVFNVIDTINKKTTNTISMEDPSFLIQRLNRLSKDLNTKNPSYEVENSRDNENLAT